ncbi:MFS transporter [Acerihabitans sp. KWT182]|uniref:MFS transporter n=1 Tax=Acerihabitans sp. KWT182 TaxID=3157919 RepID=A0AAU7QEG4_9GAMM
MSSDVIRNLQTELPWLKLILFTITVFFVGVAEFMLSSMLPPLANAFGTTVDKAALLISGYAFSYAISAPIIGYFSKKIDGVKLLLISILLYGIDNAFIIFSPTLEWAIVLRVFGGISSAIIIPVVFFPCIRSGREQQASRRYGIRVGRYDNRYCLWPGCCGVPE